jgi:GntR family transcriptional regulator
VTSKTRRLIDDITQQIEDGMLKPGDQLPSAAQLRKQYEVSITVVRGAMLWLKASGLVEGVPGVGVFVALPVGRKPNSPTARTAPRVSLDSVPQL